MLAQIEAAAGEIVEFTRDLIRIPTINPPGDGYADCARLIGSRLRECGFDVDLIEATGRPEHTPAYPRVNVVGSMQPFRKMQRSR